MSVRVRSLNSDSSFLITFCPPFAPYDPQGRFPGSFTVLLDPWLFGPSKVFSSKFAVTSHVVQPCIDSLAELPEPDLVLVSQDKSDHCHQETLQQLPRDTEALILGTPAAVKKIKSWKYFDAAQVDSLKRYDEKRLDTVYRIAIPALSSCGSPGEVTISLLVSKLDLTGLHNAIGITYRPPSSSLSTKSPSSYVDLPLTPPTSPPGSPLRPVTPSSTTMFPPPFGDREKTVSVLYSPHGVQYETVKPYASSHLLAEAALPLTALLHSFNRLENPWYMGGTVCAGYTNGIEIAANLYAKAWIGAHDELKESSGVAVKALKLFKAELDDVNTQLRLFNGNGKGPKSGCTTFLRELGAGEDYFLPAR